MRRLLAWLPIVAIATLMLGGSAWAWAKAPADVMLSLPSAHLAAPFTDTLAAPGALPPFLCHL
jgi:hypothetical protein